MCGIAGAINYKEFDLEAIKQSLYHRGPNEQAIYTKDNIALIHTRLSIQDIASGHQPLSYGKYTIIFNGEIYNHKRLREELLSDVAFSTHSDTETLLQLYIKYQDKMFDYLDGMYAFVVYDSEQNILFIARDRAGKKPLYLYQNHSSILFASELNSIKAGVNNLQIDNEAISAYLRSGFFYKYTTPYKDVITIENGSYYKIDISTLKVSKYKYFDMLDYYKRPNNLSKQDTLDTLDNLLRRSIKDRLDSSDLEVGAFLSGGIDSSLVVSLASEYVSKLRTFTVSFDGAFDEASLARLVANKYNTNHTQLSISMNLRDDIESIISNYGQPYMDSSAIPSYYVSREAKKHVTVILNGDGADELFGGYRRYVPIANNLIEYTKYISFIKGLLPKPKSKMSKLNYIYRLLSLANKKGADFYLSATNDIFEDVYTFSNNKYIQEINELVNSISDVSPLSKMLYLDSELLLFSDLLVKMDIATMANSLEGRSPFLSKYMLEFAPTIKDEYKINKLTTKYILRELASKYIPDELITQPKRGFEVPLRQWVDNELRENIYEALIGNAYSKEFVDSKFVDDVLHNRVDMSPDKRAKILWSMYCLEIWRKGI